MVTPETALFSAYEDFSRYEVSEPEKNLMRAILNQALDDLGKSGILYREARAFVLDERDGYLYSFKSICYHLNVCPKSVRHVAGLTQQEHLAA